MLASSSARLQESSSALRLASCSRSWNCSCSRCDTASFCWVAAAALLLSHAWLITVCVFTNSRSCSCISNSCTCSITSVTSVPAQGFRYLDMKFSSRTK